MPKTIYRLAASTLIPCLVLSGIPMGAQAALVSTEQAMVSAASDADRERVAQFFSRQEVQSALQAQGLSASDALARAQALSDAEVAQLADRVGQAPAGAGAVEVLFTVFLILLVTDLLGFTSVFPFTSSSR